jgi:hypothetical protein
VRIAGIVSLRGPTRRLGLGYKRVWDPTESVAIGLAPKCLGGIVCGHSISIVLHSECHR